MILHVKSLDGYPVASCILSWTSASDHSSAFSPILNAKGPMQSLLVYRGNKY